jgi:hypothetical protein
VIKKLSLKKLVEDDGLGAGVSLEIDITPLSQKSGSKRMSGA